MFRVNVGQIVLYYQNGVRNCVPRPAMVMQGSGVNSSISIDVFPEQGGSLAFKRCVYHINDPHLQKNPQVAMSYGAWEHVVPASVDPPDAVAPEAAAPVPGPAVHSPAVVAGEPESSIPETGDPQADLMHKLLATAGK